VQLRVISTRRPRNNIPHSHRRRATQHQEATLRLGIMVILHQEVTHHRMVHHLQATMVLHRLDTHLQVIHRRVLHRPATRHQAIHHREVERRRAIPQRQAIMELHQAVEDHLTVHHQGTILQQAIMGLQVEAPTHRQRQVQTPIMPPLAAIHMHVLLLKIHMADRQMPGNQALLAVHRLALRQEVMTTTGTAVVGMVAGMRGMDLHLQVATTGNHSSHMVTLTRSLRQPTRQLRIHITMLMGRLLSSLQVAIPTVVEVAVAEPTIAIAHIEVRRRLPRIGARVRS